MQQMMRKKGRIVREIFVERILFEGIPKHTVGHVGVVFDDEAALKFGCGGDGSVQSARVGAH